MNALVPVKKGAPLYWKILRRGLWQSGREVFDSQPTDKKRKNPSGWTGVIYVRDMRNVKPPSSLLQYRDEAMSIGVSLCGRVAMDK